MLILAYNICFYNFAIKNHWQDKNKKLNAGFKNVMRKNLRKIKFNKQEDFSSGTYLKKLVLSI